MVTLIRPAHVSHRQKAEICGGDVVMCDDNNKDLWVWNKKHKVWELISCYFTPF